MSDAGSGEFTGGGSPDRQIPEEYTDKIYDDEQLADPGDPNDDLPDTTPPVGAILAERMTEAVEDDPGSARRDISDDHDPDALPGAIVSVDKPPRGEVGRMPTEELVVEPADYQQPEPTEPVAGSPDGEPDRVETDPDEERPAVVADTDLPVTPAGPGEEKRALGGQREQPEQATLPTSTSGEAGARRSPEPPVPAPGRPEPDLPDRVADRLRELGEVDVRSFVHDHCIEEVQRGLTNIERAVADGTFDRSGYDGATISNVYRDMVFESIESGDWSQAEANLDVLLELPKADDYTMAEACYAVAVTGNQGAFDALSGLLEAEKSEAIAQVALRPGMHARAFTLVLDEIIANCESNGTPPNAWIDKYAIDAEDRWGLYANHYARMAKLDTADAEASQEEFERMVSELVADKSFDPVFVYDQAWYLLKTVKNPELRTQLLERYKEVTAKIPLTLQALRDFFMVGDAVLTDPTLATQGNVGFFENTAVACTEVLQNIGVDSFELAKEQLWWKVGIRSHHGATPQELIEYVDAQIRLLLAADIPETSEELGDVLRTKEYVLQRRDTLIGSYASASARAGDFVKARIFLANLGSEVSQAFALAECLSYATTQGQIDTIKPDEVTLMFNPGLGMQFRVAEALLGGDPKTLSNLILELAGTKDEVTSYVIREDIRRMYGVVTDKQSDIDLTRKLLAALRESGVKTGYIEVYSKILIRAGDNDELLSAYEAIDKKSPNASRRLRSMRELACLLEES